MGEGVRAREVVDKSREKRKAESEKRKQKADRRRKVRKLFAGVPPDGKCCVGKR